MSRTLAVQKRYGSIGYGLWYRLPVSTNRQSGPMLLKIHVAARL